MRPFLSLMSPEGSSARLSILIFHRVVAQVDPLFPDEVHAARFDALCGWLARDFNVLPLSPAVRRLREGSLPRRALSITFDDGYADNHDIALPILQRHGLHATFFVATGFLNGGRMWNDTVVEAVRSSPLSSLDLGSLGLQGVTRLSIASLAEKQSAIRQLLSAVKYLDPAHRLAVVNELARVSIAELPDDLMMTSAQVVGLHAAGMTIGGHTVNHPILAVLSDADARREIAVGRDTLQDTIQAPVTAFAYPNGRPSEDYSPRTVELVRELGFELAVATSWGAARVNADHYQLPRFTPWDRSRGRFNLRIAANLLRR